MDATDVLTALRSEGITAHHAVRKSVTPSGQDLVVVYLEASHAQWDSAAACLTRLPGVERVSFATHTRAIVYVLFS